MQLISSEDVHQQPQRVHEQFRELGYLNLVVGPLEGEMAQLRGLLQSALKLEHATIPPYLTGLYTMTPAMPWEVAGIVRTVVVEEMLHMVLAANTLNAIGGDPDLTAPGFILDYPEYLPLKVDDLPVSLIGFSPAFIQQALAIERPKYIDPLRVALGPKTQMTIGEFYAHIESKLRSIVREYGEKAVFTGDTQRQIRPDMFYYGGSGQPVEVHNLETAVQALGIITDQGEGIERTIWTDDQMSPGSFKEVAHYFRFNEIAQGRRYRQGDTYKSGPTGEPLHVPFDDVLQIKQNAKVKDYPLGSEVRSHAERFNEQYCRFLHLLQRAFRGESGLLLEAVPQMYKLRDAAQQLINNPFPGAESPCFNASPTFEYVSIPSS